MAKKIATTKDDIILVAEAEKNRQEEEKAKKTLCDLFGYSPSHVELSKEYFNQKCPQMCERISWKLELEQRRSRIESYESNKVKEVCWLKGFQGESTHEQLRPLYRAGVYVIYIRILARHDRMLVVSISPLPCFVPNATILLPPSCIPSLVISRVYGCFRAALFESVAERGLHVHNYFHALGLRSRHRSAGYERKNRRK